jgi:hypothetical protein
MIPWSCEDYQKPNLAKSNQILEFVTKSKHEKKPYIAAIQTLKQRCKVHVSLSNELSNLLKRQVFKSSLQVRDCWCLGSL